MEKKGTEETQAIVVEGLSTSELVNLTHTFKNMTNLRLLHMDTMGVNFIKPEYLPSSLQYLSWNNYSANSLPDSFGSGKLVGLQMNSSSYLQLWKGVKNLHGLKFIDCSHSKKLNTTPNFTGVPNLERLDLTGCSSLIKVHESIRSLEKLELLDLSYCYDLRSFPSYFLMKSLKTLSLYHCHKFRKFPEIQERMDKLSHIYLHNTAIQELPSSIVNLPNLSALSLVGCINLVCLPQSIGMLQRLIYLDVRQCNKLATLPQELGSIGCLEHLLVSTLTRLPSSIIHLKNLKTFLAVEPPSSISQKRGVLGMFSIAACLFSKQRETKHSHVPGYSLYHILPSLLSLTSLKELGLCNLHEGMILPVDVGTLSSLEYLILCDNQFGRLPFTISQLHVLKSIDLSNCQRLEALPELPPTVAVVFANNCKSLRTITGLLSAQRLLRQVSLLGCTRLEDQLFDTNTVKVLQTALQGYNVVKHETTILLPGSEIPRFFQPEITGVGQIVIELTPNWHEVIKGISLCVVADVMGLTRPVSLTLSTQHIASVNRSGSYHSNRLHTWLEYVSFDLLQRSYLGILRPDWITTTPGLILTISTESSGVKICGVRLIPKELNMEEISTCIEIQMADSANKQANLLKCFREAEYDAITYVLQPGIKYVPEDDAIFDRLSWKESHEHYRSGRSSMKVAMNILD